MYIRPCCFAASSPSRPPPTPSRPRERTPVPSLRRPPDPHPAPPPLRPAASPAGRPALSPPSWPPSSACPSPRRPPQHRRQLLGAGPAGDAHGAPAAERHVLHELRDLQSGRPVPVRRALPDLPRRGTGAPPSRWATARRPWTGHVLPRRARHRLGAHARRWGERPAPPDRPAAPEPGRHARLRQRAHDPRQHGERHRPVVRDPGPRAGLGAVRRVLASGVRPDALLCLNDQLALGALRALHGYGARVPEDVAVIGFDDVEGGRFGVPSLSTVAPDTEAVARVAVELLLRRIEEAARRPDEADGPAAEHPQDRVVAHRLVLRESTEGSGGRDGVW
ncbi:substrate-binding domain-containing protein [Streptomyces sp. SID9727]|uniref:substrate-binding domain-containing protein n=1 Tax=Streptomyces sp. SID9727 TaxID=2706114 RepID=UPI001EF18249|nr:substrate-binding domain-containing protein [Streptomyces sp. SID9727]